MLASYQITEKDLLEAQTSAAGARISRLLGALLIAAGLVDVVFAKGQYPEGLVPIVVGAFLLFRFRLSAKLSFKRDVAGLGKVEATMSGSGIQFLSAKGTADVNWSAFIRYRETRNLFLLYSQTRYFHIIPKRAFAPADLRQFRETLQQNLAEKSSHYKKEINPRLMVFLAIVIVMSVLLGLILVRSRS